MGMVDTQIEFDSALLSEVQVIFQAQGLTVEDAILAFMRKVVDDPQWAKVFFENAEELADAPP